MKRIDLDQMKNMSIDDLIELYRNGYRLEEHTPITSLSKFNNFNFFNIHSHIYSLQGPLLDPVVNFGKVTVSTGYDASATSIVLISGEGSKLPDPSTLGPFNIVWWNSTDYPDPSDDANKEIVRCTVRSTDTLTVTRAQEGTSASIKNLSGKTYKMILSITAKTITDISSAISARVAKSGDTMTGTLNLPSNGLIVGTNQLMVSGGNVGIGTTVPSTRLTVTNGSGIRTQITLSDMATASIMLRGGASTDGVLASDVGLRFRTGAAWDNADNLGTTVMTMTTGGNVGIGTTSPNSKLEIVSGEIRVSDGGGPQAYRGNLSVTTGVNNFFDIFGYKDGLGAGGINLILNRYGGNVGIGTTSPFGKLTNSSVNITDAAGNGGDSNNSLFWTVDTQGYSAIIQNSQATAGHRSGLLVKTAATDSSSWVAKFESGGNNRVTIRADGNVGIGTTSPQSPLHINSPTDSPVAIRLSRAGSTDAWAVYRYGSALNDRFCIGVVGVNEPFRITTNGHVIMAINSSDVPSGNVGIGVPVPIYQFQLSYDSAAKPGTNTWTISSDERIKKDIRPFTDGIDTIININPIWYKYNGKGGFKDDNIDHIGVIGQHVKNIAPYTINTYKAKLNEDDKEETELLNFNSHALTFVLINAVKELKIENEILKDKNIKLEERIDLLENKLSIKTGLS